MSRNTNVDGGATGLVWWLMRGGGSTTTHIIISRSTSIERNNINVSIISDFYSFIDIYIISSIDIICSYFTINVYDISIIIRGSSGCSSMEFIFSGS